MEYQALNFSNARILVIGDIMLDQYWHGDAGRISPEAPVPVVHVNRVHETPGGAGNVAINLASLGVKTILMGFTGQDAAANRVEQLLIEAGIECFIKQLPTHPTITKLRILSRNQQLIRLDTETLFEEKEQTTLIEEYTRLLNRIDAIILADYNKGALCQMQTLIQLAKNAKIPILIDPKKKDFSIYHGANIITPNLKEFEEVVGYCATVSEMCEKAQALIEKEDLQALVITRAEQGVSVIEKDQEPYHIPALAREVFDVTGAGDTVIAVMGAALASKMSLRQAATLGNLAAGIVVGKLGTATVSVNELKAALKINAGFATGILSEDNLIASIRASQAQGEKIVFTNGCFDILHAGHVSYLAEAKNLGDRVVVAVNDDDSVRRLKGPKRPINNLADRMSVLAGLRYVDWVVPFSEDTPQRIIQLINPDILVKGGDYKNVEELAGAKFILNQGGCVKILGLKEGVSTTQTIKTIVVQENEYNISEE
ncbi:MAG: bifunctional heptose 7-phosphate kinase/heptose 1-phosphate adenyltransferase [Francisellaceae bacterium]|nr:bifunctional heptose 7-phosphate kinase/heptose 1-phosphate adenyltransferase [Francisellaceae bacterium]